LSDPMFVVWVCDNRQSSLPLVGEIGCGHMNILRSKKRNGSRLDRWMAVCKQCGAKKSLNRGIIRDFENKAEATLYILGMGELE
jgi:hypothetical protein